MSEELQECEHCGIDQPESIYPHKDSLLWICPKCLKHYKDEFSKADDTKPAKKYKIKLHD